MSGPADSTSQILFLLTVELDSLDGWSDARKADMQRRFPKSQGRCWPVSRTFSTDLWNVALCLHVASCHWGILQTVEWDAFLIRNTPSGDDVGTLSVSIALLRCFIMLLLCNFIAR